MSAYPLSWARRIFADFRKKHARGTEIMKDLYGWDDTTIINFLVDGSPKWARFKTAAKVAERYQ